MKKNYLLLLISLAFTASFAQVGIGTTTPNAQLEIKSSSETAPASTDGLLNFNIHPILIASVNAFKELNVK